MRYASPFLCLVLTLPTIGWSNDVCTLNPFLAPSAPVNCFSSILDGGITVLAAESFNYVLVRSLNIALGTSKILSLQIKKYGDFTALLYMNEY